MKKNKRIAVIVIILVIIGIIFVINKMIGNKNSNIQELSKIYEELSSSQTYQFEL